jgi:hypothetical protein
VLTALFALFELTALFALSELTALSALSALFALAWRFEPTMVVNTANTNNRQININSQNLNILSSQDTNNTKSNTKKLILKMGLAFGCFNGF